MEKPIWKSKTVWGGLLLALETAFIALQVQYVWAHVVASALGTFLTIYGFRDTKK